MKYIKAFLIKFIISTAILWVILGIFSDTSFNAILTTSLILTAISFIGDIFILPNIGSFTAITADFALAFVTIWIIGEYLFYDAFGGIAAFFSAVMIAIGEIFYHRYIKNQVLNEENNRSPNSRNRLQTETSEELNPEPRKRR